MKRRQILGCVAGFNLLFALSLRGQEMRPDRERAGARILREEAQSVAAPNVPTREAQAAASRLVKLSGVLAEPRSPVNGPAEMTLALYKDEIGGEPLWTEVQTVEIDKQGRYTVLIGATQAEGLPVELFPSGEALCLAKTQGR